MSVLNPHFFKTGRRTSSGIVGDEVSDPEGTDCSVQVIRQKDLPPGLESHLNDGGIYYHHERTVVDELREKFKYLSTVGIRPFKEIKGNPTLEKLWHDLENDLKNNRHPSDQVRILKERFKEISEICELFP